jgi:hypothetical protein
VTTPEPPAPDPGEGRLLGYLGELRENPPTSDSTITKRVHRSARWQHAIRGPLQFVEQLAGALTIGFSAIFKSKESQR